MLSFTTYRISDLFPVIMLIGSWLFAGNLLAQQGSPNPSNFSLDGKTHSVSFEIDRTNNIGGAPLSVSADQSASFRIRVLITPSPDQNLTVLFSNGAGIQFEQQETRWGFRTGVSIPAQPSLTQDQTINLRFSLMQVNGEKAGGPFSIPIRLKAAAPSASLSDCQQSNSANQLACLERILAGLSDSEKARAQASIDQLKRQRSAVRNFLQEIKRPYDSASRAYRIRNLSNHLLGYTTIQGGRLRIRDVQGGIIVEAPKPGNYTLRVSSVDWPDLGSVDLPFKFQFEEGSSQPPIEIPEEEPADSETSNDPAEESEAFMEDPPMESESQLSGAAEENESEKEGEWLIPILVVAGITILLMILIVSRRGKGKGQPESSGKADPNADNHDAEISETPMETPVIRNEDDDGVAEIESMEEEEFSIDIVEHEALPDEEVERLTISELAHSRSHLPVEMSPYWEESFVKQIFLNHQSIEAIDRMVKDQNYYVPDSDAVEEVPEIGGFLLGHVYALSEGGVDVSIETFVPITADSQNRYTVKFGGKAWSELDDSLKANPGMKLLGWFHTHPGHGLFLSEADLREHFSLFRQPHQIAMEIDPLTPGYDTAFFTWKDPQAENVNNAEDRLQNDWWQFTHLYQASRTRMFQKPQ